MSGAEDLSLDVLCAEVFLEGLDRRGVRTSDRVLVDHLPEEIADELFAGLMREADVKLDVPLTGEDGTVRTVAVDAIRRDEFDVLPYRALGERKGDSANRGSTGFASCLRDYFALDATRPRVLVVITAEGNETQKSAQDLAADHLLITRSGLLQRYMDGSNVTEDSPVREVATAYERYAPPATWQAHVSRFADFVEAVCDAPEEQQGGQLWRLGCFLPDPTPGYTQAPRMDQVIDGERDRQLRRGPGGTRLDDNAVICGFVRGLFDSPLEDPEATLEEMFPEHPDVADKIAADGPEGLRQLRLDAFSGASLRIKKEQNGFRLDLLEVAGATAWQLVDTGTTKPVLLISSGGTPVVQVMLKRNLDLRKERAQRLGWNAEGGAAEREELGGFDGKDLLEWTLPASPAGQMRVHRLALTRGPRAITKPHDYFDVVLYGVDAPVVWREHKGVLAPEHHAWRVEEGDEPKFVESGGKPDTEIDVAPVGEPVNQEESGVELARWRPAGREVELSTATFGRVITDVGATDAESASPPVDLPELMPLIRGASVPIREAFRTAKAYQAAIQSVRWSDGCWTLDIAHKKGKLTRRVFGLTTWDAQSSVAERSAARSLLDPSVRRWTLRAGDLEPEGWSDKGRPASTQAMLDARHRVFELLALSADERLGERWRDRRGAGVPIPLLSLIDGPVAEAIESYVEAWVAAAEENLSSEGQFSPASSELLQQDTLLVQGEADELERLVVLPTHPWLLGCLLAFQRRMADLFGMRRGRLALDEDEVRKLVPHAAVESWFVYERGSDRRLESVGSAPFHLEFVPATGTADGVEPPGYVSRIIARRLGRYVQMHPHLRSARRTLRMGFVHPGSGERVLEGLRGWVKAVQQERGDRLRHIDSETLPALEVLLFHDPEADQAAVGKAFDHYFRENVGGPDTDSVEQALLSRLAYRKIPSLQPRSAADAVHVCFVRGLVRASTNGDKSKSGPLTGWWDGGFADGAMASYLRQTTRAGVGARLHSRRGLWLHADSDRPLRKALAHIHSLQAGCHFGSLDVGQGLYRACPLPNMEELGETYEHSDWVVHLDRELSLDVFSGVDDGPAPTIIEYSDHEVPETPGFDTITVTRRAGPYKEQLSEILTLAALDISEQREEGRRSAERLLEDLNVLSGRWALDFLHGSMAENERGNRLKGNVGAALCYRWLRRTEAPTKGLVQTNVGPAVPVFISLEEHMRATAAGGLPTGTGWKELHKWLTAAEDDTPPPEGYSDDLLVLYVTPTVEGAPSRLFGRVIEVKFGSSAGASGPKGKGVVQVASTQRVLRDLLSDEALAVREPFRNRQVSLLLKAQLEQAMAVGALDNRIYDDLNVRALSANLATGNYSVDYALTAEVDGRWEHIQGDVFLLHTAGDDSSDQPKVEVVDGVRVVTLPRRLVEWLAFEEADSPTLTEAPPNTQPNLGRLIGAPHTSAPPPAASPADPGGEPGEDDDLDDAPTVELVAARPTPSLPDDPPRSSGPPLDEAASIPVKQAPYPDSVVADAILRLERGLAGHKVKLQQEPSHLEADRGPRLVRAYVRLAAGETLQSVRRISEDLAREVGTRSSDIHISNVPERHAIALDLPVADLEYSVSYGELAEHASFAAAGRDLRLGLCAGIDVTGRAVWVDLAKMPHMLVAGTTGSGKTVFLRSVILTLLSNAAPGELVLRLSSSKPMDFMPFTQLPAASGRELAREPRQALALARELVEEMDRRIDRIADAWCDDIAGYNAAKPEDPLPYVVAVFDEFSEMAASFEEKADRSDFEAAIGRLAQKARAAGIHLIVCMQRPDANALKGAIKANILHRFALKLPAQHDSRVILDDNGAETLLGQGDMLYKDANGRLHRLQVPYLDGNHLKRTLREMLATPDVSDLDINAIKSCPKCGREGPIGELFGVRRVRHQRADGSEGSAVRPQSYCTSCRSQGASEQSGDDSS